LNQIISSPDIRYIIWYDAHSQGGPEWVDADDSREYAQMPLPLIRQVGIVLYETEDYIAITDTLGSAMTGTVHSIPKGMIVSMITAGGLFNDDHID
jgi:hypothetical protein